MKERLRLQVSGRPVHFLSFSSFKYRISLLSRHVCAVYQVCISLCQFGSRYGKPATVSPLHAIGLILSQLASYFFVH